MTGFSSRQVTTWLHQRAVYLLGEGCYFCACMISKKDSLEKPVAHVGLWKNSPLSFSATCSIIFNLPPRPAFSSMGLNVMHRNSSLCVKKLTTVLSISPLYCDGESHSVSGRLLWRSLDLLFRTQSTNVAQYKYQMWTTTVVSPLWSVMISGFLQSHMWRRRVSLELGGSPFWWEQSTWWFLVYCLKGGMLGICGLPKNCCS